jgi:hypothetical protein
LRLGLSGTPFRADNLAFCAARRQPIAAEAGAATLVWTRRFDVIEFAVVLEPDKLGGCGWFALDALPERLTRATLAAAAAMRPSTRRFAAAQDD